jgi:hypothetical protein
MAKNCAVVIGINEYDEIQHLKYAKTDAEQVRDYFLHDLGVQPEYLYFFSDDSPHNSSGRRTQPTYGTLISFLGDRFAEPFFYQIFLTFHTLLFELLGQPGENAEGYNFTSVEVKEKAFRFDGIFMPDTVEKPIYFVEVQFQPKPEFYWELITEINIYLNQYKPQQDWQAVALFAKRSLDVEVLTPYQQELINSGRIKRIYLDEIPPGSIGMGLIELILIQREQGTGNREHFDKLSASQEKLMFKNMRLR